MRADVHRSWPDRSQLGSHERGILWSPTARRRKAPPKRGRWLVAFEMRTHPAKPRAGGAMSIIIDLTGKDSVA
jgi:hypothetical protein